jgi:hypothetical protein
VGLVAGSCAIVPGCHRTVPSHVSGTPACAVGEEAAPTPPRPHAPTPPRPHASTPPCATFSRNSEKPAHSNSHADRPEVAVAAMLIWFLITQRSRPKHCAHEGGVF